MEQAWRRRGTGAEQIRAESTWLADGPAEEAGDSCEVGAAEKVAVEVSEVAVAEAVAAALAGPPAKLRLMARLSKAGVEASLAPIAAASMLALVGVAVEKLARLMGVPPAGESPADESSSKTSGCPAGGAPHQGAGVCGAGVCGSSGPSTWASGVLGGSAWASATVGNLGR